MKPLYNIGIERHNSPYNGKRQQYRFKHIVNLLVMKNSITGKLVDLKRF